MEYGWLISLTFYVILPIFTYDGKTEKYEDGVPLSSLCRHKGYKITLIVVGVISAIAGVVAQAMNSSTSTIFKLILSVSIALYILSLMDDVDKYNANKPKRW